MSRFHFITNWSLNATAEEVYAIIHDSASLTRWWPSVYLDVKTEKEGDENGIGKIISLYTKGYLPYTLRWTFEVTEVEKNKRIAIKAFGDLIGTGIWTINANNAQCDVIYDWDITFDKPFLSKLTWLLRPFFEFNHKWAMNKGLESILLEIRRRRKEVNVPEPPTAVLVF